MKTIKVRDLQHNLARVLGQVERGEAVEVLRRNKAVARIVPPEAPPIPIPWPNPLKRLQTIYGNKRVSSPTSELLYQDRGNS